jgi:hypothetical protein
MHGETAVFLDPPYVDGDAGYAVDSKSVSADVREWALANGDRMRIALCGYDGEHEMPGWTVHEWKAKGGYANKNTDPDAGNNKHRERIWFSPRCPKAVTRDPS